MKNIIKALHLLSASILLTNSISATNYYIHPELGNDVNSGTHILSPLKSLMQASTLNLQEGDAILLAAGYTFEGMLKIQGKSGLKNNPIRISSYQWGNRSEDPRAIIDARNSSHGIHLVDCSHIIIENLIIQANDTGENPSEGMRCGVLVVTNKPGKYENITLKKLLVRDVFVQAPGFQRGKKEVNTANGTQQYGWGIRFINRVEGAIFKDLTVTDCVIKNVAHTGIKFTSRGQSTHNIKVYNNRVLETGGPGIQMSGIQQGHIKNNFVNRSGSNNDSRKWGRGSGLWTWGCAGVVIENNHFMNANGPADSAGCHIDFNCNDIVVQYNFSMNNAGGFCEILGNNYNCAYRYNISVNDGHRIKGVNGAWQAGKTFWLSGFQGKNKPRKGPYNSYFYNNTIYTSKDIASKVAVDRNAHGILIANNIFHIESKGKMVLGDQYTPEKEGAVSGKHVFFENNLYLLADYWPKEVWVQDAKKLVGDAQFSNIGGDQIIDYIPNNISLIKDKGIDIPMIPNDTIGLKIGLLPNSDIFGNPIIGKPDLGAIEIGGQ